MGNGLQTKQEEKIFYSEVVLITVSVGNMISKQISHFIIGVKWEMPSLSIKFNSLFWILYCLPVLVLLLWDILCQSPLCVCV